ncbi:MAG: MlaD family protein [Nitrospinaceae bacterium]
MDYRSSEVKAGGFIFLSLLALIVMVFILGDVKEHFKPKKNVRIVFNFTGGLEVGAPVRYAGLQVGRVANIHLLHSGNKTTRDRVTVVTEISPSIDVKKNSIVSIKSSGFMGGPYIEIIPGTPDSPPLKEGESLYGEDSFQFAQIGDMMEEVVRQVRRFTQLADDLTSDSRNTLKAFQSSLDNVNSILLDNRDEIRGNLRNLLKISRQLSNILDKNGEQIRSTIQHIASVAEKSDKLFSEKEKRLAQIIDQTHQWTQDLKGLLKDNRQGLTRLIGTMETDAQKISTNLGSATASLEKTLHQSSAILVENRRNLYELLKNLNESSRNLKSITEDIKLNPWKLVRKTQEKSAESKQELTTITAPGGIRMKRLDKVSSK